MFLAREIEYDKNWRIIPKIKDLNLVQCYEQKTVEKLRFEEFLDITYLTPEFLNKFTFPEFEIPFKHNLTYDFLDPEISILDQWIFESIPFQNSSMHEPSTKPYDIPCFSATRFASGRATAMKSHILSLIAEHSKKLFNEKFANKIINQNYEFENYFDHEKIKTSYFNNNQEILWKRNQDCSLTPWVRNADIIDNKCHFKGPWLKAHNLNFRKKNYFT